MRGGAEARSFELMIADLAEWFIEHPDSAWREQLGTAAATEPEQLYVY
jgi:hypothetical protein